jgi:pyridoxal phosphate enzyme (YggS family)
MTSASIISRIERALQGVRARIEAARRTGETVSLLAVTKTFPASVIRAAHAAGQRAFGENYVQEALAKQEALADLPDLEWHLIGPLQGNKARQAAERFQWVETVDRLKIAERLSAARPAGLPPLNVLVQVNISGEATKHGVPPGEALALARAVAALPRLRLRGLMGISEPGVEPARVAGQFRALRALFEALRREGVPVDTLSMGMSGDLEAAIAEGSTEVRVGTAIFGERPPAPSSKAAA